MDNLAWHVYKCPGYGCGVVIDIELNPVLGSLLSQGLVSWAGIKIEYVGGYGSEEEAMLVTSSWQDPIVIFQAVPYWLFDLDSNANQWREAFNVWQKILCVSFLEKTPTEVLRDIKTSISNTKFID